MSAPRCVPVLALAAVLAGPGAAQDVHVVESGETLWTIARDRTGDPERWREIYRANRDQIQDPSRLYPGQRLAIPELPAPGGEEASRPAEPAAE